MMTATAAPPSSATPAPTGSSAALLRARPTVSAIAINYNGGQRILNTVRHLKEQAYPLQEIVVVDNQSTDGSPAAIREQFPDVFVLDMGCNDGLPKARNAGLARVSSELVLLVDNDVYVAPDCLDRMIDAWGRHDKPAVVCPRVVLIPETDTVQAEGAETHFMGSMVLRHAYAPLASLSDEEAEVGGCIGACYLLHRQPVMDAGAFDEVFFFYHEDLEFAVRLRSLGHRFLCVPAAVVNHDRGVGTVGLSFRGSENKYPTRRAFLSMRHRILLILIHYRLWTLIVLAPALLLYEVACFGIAILKGWVGVYFKAWWWNLTNPRLILERRRRVQSRRVRTDKQVLVGGPLPVSPGFLRSGFASTAFGLLSRTLDAYWRLARALVP